MTFVYLADYRELMVKVATNSTIRVRTLRDSAPRRLIVVMRLDADLRETCCAVSGVQEVEQLPLNRGNRGVVIHFHNVIGHLLRKPGAFTTKYFRLRPNERPTSI